MTHGPGIVKLVSPNRSEKRRDGHRYSDPASWQTEHARRRSLLALRDMTTNGRWQGTVGGE